ncbi:MAG TPA: TrmH family RNA methyltransferase [Actinomycetota bacterium]|nr:TrmH family RNA methyltransferase [Actinomycetota bacterium]
MRPDDVPRANPPRETDGAVTSRPRLSSPRNRQVVRAARLKKRAFRERDRRFLVEGPQAVGAALGTAPVDALFVAEGAHGELATRADRLGVPVYSATPDVIGHLSSTVTPQGVVAAAGFVDMPLADLPARPDLVALLCAIRDPGNTGTIIRSAEAAGADAVVVTEGSVDVYNAKAVRSTAGSLFHLPLVREVSAADAVTALRARGMQVIAADGRAETPVEAVDLSRPTAILFGNEAWGLPPEVRDLADLVVRVPIRGRAESLNVAAAAAVILFVAADAASRTAPPPAASAGPAGTEAEFTALVAAAAHDLRSPLAAMQSVVGMLLERWARLTDEQRDELLGALAGETERAQVAIRRVVDGARLSMGSLPLDPVPTDLRELAERAVALAAGQRSGLRIELGGGPARALVDRDRMLPAAMALLEVAAWAESDAPIEVRTIAGEPAALEVRRAGAALTPADLTRLFTPQGGDRALGLWEARALAEAHGGALDAEAGDDGLVLRLRLPGPSA